MTQGTDTVWTGPVDDDHHHVARLDSLKLSAEMWTPSRVAGVSLDDMYVDGVPDPTRTWPISTTRASPSRW